MAERLLIIDDDARLAAMVSDYLAAAGFVVERRFTGRDGLAALDGGAFDAIILDRHAARHRRLRGLPDDPRSALRRRS